jgi:glycosyltransferase involved in cell wall biosynthesis
MATSPPGPVRLVYITQYYSTPSMVGGTRAYEWVSRLVAAGYDVHVVTSDKRAQGGSVVTVESGATVRWLPVRYDNSMSIPRRMVAFLQFAVLAAWHARRARADVVFASSTPLTVAIPALAALVGRSTPLVFEVRDLWPDVPIAMGGLRNPVLKGAARALERAAYRNATRVIALSPEMRAGVVRAGFPREAVALVPNASDLDLFRRPGAEEEGERFRREHAWLGDRPLVLYTGTIGRVNDLVSMVEIAAAARTLDPDLRFLVVGEGAERDNVVDLARRRGVLDETFFLLPPRPKAEMPGLFAAASLTTSFVADIPVLRWNSANKVFDGFAARRPVATNLDGSIGGLLRQTGAGLVLDRDPGTAARQLVDFLTDPDAVADAELASGALGDRCFSRDVLFEVFEDAVAGASREGRVVRRLRPADVPPDESWSGLPNWPSDVRTRRSAWMSS